MNSIKPLINYTPKIICEVGTFKPESLHCADLIEEASKVIFVEANPKCVEQLRLVYKGDKFSIFPVAVADYDGLAKLYQRQGRNGEDASAFISSIEKPPAVVNDGYVPNDFDAIEITAVPFSYLDEGNIDTLFIDIEGAEWFVLKHMVSRPKLICLETHGQKYTNPYIKEINRWLFENEYTKVASDESDTTYLKIETGNSH